MGEVIQLDQRRLARKAALEARAQAASPAVAPPATLWFDLASPSTYLAAERAGRMFPGLTWRPVLTGRAEAAQPWHERGRDAAMRAAASRASELRMPLVWPDGTPSCRAAMRVAAFATECGQGSAFVLAASRLAFCGGFDLDDPEILAEAAAAAALPFEECLRAAGDRARDVFMEAAGQDLLARGADAFPVLSVGRQLFCGEERLGQAAAVVRDPATRDRPAPWDESAG